MDSFTRFNPVQFKGKCKALNQLHAPQVVQMYHSFDAARCVHHDQRSNLSLFKKGKSLRSEFSWRRSFADGHSSRSLPLDSVLRHPRVPATGADPHR